MATEREKLKAKNVDQLKKMLKKKGIVGYSSLSKRQLINAVMRGGLPGSGRHSAGTGAFKLVIKRGRESIAEIGPYTTGRAAAVDLKELLRRMAPIEDYQISQAAGREYLGKKLPGSNGGVIADGYVVLPKADVEDPDLAGFVLRYPSGSKKAYVGVKTKGPATAARPNRGRKKTRRKSKKRNPRVSFQTKDGPVSFWTKKKKKR